MIILHANWIIGTTDFCKLALWGEQDEGINKKKKSGKIKEPFHPFSVNLPQLSQILSESLFLSERFKPEQGNIFLSLPGSKNNPLPSSALLNINCSQENPALHDWTIPALFLSPLTAVEFFCGLGERNMLTQGVILGEEILFLIHLFKYTVNLLLKQQVIPSMDKKLAPAGIKQGGERYFSRWEAYLNPQNISEFNKFALTIPPVLRSFSQIVNSSEIIISFVQEMLDALARISLKEKKKEDKPESIHDAWLSALSSESPEISFRKGKENSKLEIFFSQLSEWKHPLFISSGAGAGFKVCFRLEEPQEMEEKWKLSYLLQAADDPSLLIPTEKIWQEKGKTAVFLNRRFDHPQERLLSALCQASSFSPAIEKSLNTSAPNYADLETAEAYAFLTNAVWLLEQSGFGILLPSWWKKKGLKEKIHLRAKTNSPKMAGGSGLSLETLISFDWEAALGDKKISYKELQELAHLKVPLIKTRGQWMEIDVKEINSILDFWKKNKKGEVQFSEIVKMSLGWGEQEKGFSLGEVISDGWIAKTLNRLTGKHQIEDIPLPLGFSGELRPYQKRGFAWLDFLHSLGLGSCLADDMGLGKTVQTLSLLLKEKLNGQENPSLLICPTSVVGNWEREAKKFTPELKCLIHHGIERLKQEDFKKQIKKYDLIISSYALLRRDANFLTEIPFSGIILDEAQNIKNSQTKQSQTTRRLKGDYRIALTGTPVENNIGDIWSIMEFLNPGFLGTQAGFKRKFFLPIQISQDKEAISRLKQITGPLILRRLKTDKNIISDLPEKMETKVYVNLTKEQASLYEAIIKEVEQDLNKSSGIKRKGIILATLIKLKQICNHPAHLLKDNSPIPERSGKLSRLYEMLEEVLAKGEQTLIFTQFTEMGEILKKYLQEMFAIEILFLHGGVEKKKRDLMVERFQNKEKKLPILLLSLKAGGIGLNLTSANNVFHFDRWWNPAVEDQATDRAFRIGQKKNVLVYKFICQGTVEEKIDEMIEKKKKIAQGVIGTGENWITELSTAQIKELFALRRDAVAE